jgi:hypothetical protein
MRSLFFDTCAILKFFLPEKGSEVVRWLFCGQTTLLYGLWRTSSPRVRQEFFDVINRKCRAGHISQNRADQIKTTAMNMFTNSIHVRGDSPPPGLPGTDITTSELVKRHNLIAGKNDWDMEHIEKIVNHLRFLADISKVQVVTADQDFADILQIEGYFIINPEKKTVAELEKEWATP